MGDAADDLTDSMDNECECCGCFMSLQPHEKDCPVVTGTLD